jgi:hypothetical protein
VRRQGVRGKYPTPEPRTGLEESELERIGEDE